MKAEKAKLAEVMQRVTEVTEVAEKGAGGSNGDKAMGDKRRALERTREELFAWMEERLSHSASPSPEAERGARGDIHQKLLVDIHAAYTSYLNFRATLLSLILQSQFLSNPTSTASNQPELILQPILPAPSPLLTPSPHPPVPTTPLLPLLTDHLPTTIHTQKSLVLLRNHISSTLATSKDRLCKTLEQLSSESHLLREYITNGALEIEGRTPVEIVKTWEEVATVRKRAVEGEVRERMRRGG
ncbi:hypothetical protein BDZ91DRAFT_709080 [Kalaharituber pfeilii]|nr:hypothetical protein BDZ91DRAFT_709080 [Kalaharituber pfeilii]